MTTCIKSHGPEKQKGDHRFDSLTAAIKTADDALLWQEILDQLNQGEMPPHKQKQPPKPELLPAVDAITASVGEAAERFKATAPHSGAAPSEQLRIPPDHRRPARTQRRGMDSHRRFSAGVARRWLRQ